MSEENKIQIFEDRKIRTVWNESEEEWYFSIVDVVQILTDQPNFDTALKYWNKLKQRLNNEESQLVSDCHQLKMPSPKDGRITKKIFKTLLAL